MPEPAKIAADHVVSMDYTLKDDDGEVLDSSEEDGPLTYLHGHGEIIPGLERALEGREVGYSANITVSPEDGYGEHDPEKVFLESSESLGMEVEEGDILEAEMDGGVTMELVVLEVCEEGITLDGNHPLAGMDLNFEIQLLEILASH